jgi:hypothetical protein
MQVPSSKTSIIRLLDWVNRVKTFPSQANTQHTGGKIQRERNILCQLPTGPSLQTHAAEEMSAWFDRIDDTSRDTSNKMVLTK